MSTLKERVIEAVNAAKQRGHSISDIAKRCGISVQSIYQWQDPLNSLKQIKASSLLGLSELSGLNPWYVNEGTGDKVNFYTKNESQIPPFRVAEPAQDQISEDLAILDKFEAAAYAAKLESMKAAIKSVEADIRSAAHKTRTNQEKSNEKPSPAAHDSPLSDRRTA